MKRKDFIATTTAAATAIAAAPSIALASGPTEVHNTFAAKVLLYDGFVSVNPATQKRNLAHYEKDINIPAIVASKNHPLPVVVIGGWSFLLPMDFDENPKVLNQRVLRLIEEAAPRPNNDEIICNELSPKVMIHDSILAPAVVHLMNQAYANIEKHRLLVTKILIAKNLQPQFENAFAQSNPNDYLDGSHGEHDFTQGFPPVKNEDEPWLKMWTADVYVRSDLQPGWMYFLAPPEDVGVLTHYTDLHQTGMAVINPKCVYGVEVKT